MIVSGTLALDRAVQAAAAAEFAVRLSELDERRRDAEQAIDALLVSWRGNAASHFAARAHEWDSAAMEVIDSLSALLGAVDIARRELEDADEHAVAVPRQVRSRLT
ncbi:WXG100 family type VII secretion target [Nocardioides hwasunensis]|uniref:WXG100 family type VII secretion target n=1 Tax=Nocardioides hwasunensis TaxID=397258 RepID=A0ABR8MH82_9ACTN|nr:WXG100 family type VII secretion target [Nocardioides hwasunensis]MBD3915317.1 WXG100 family type VII secretion target [Nocardioides hwasunensis]